MFSASRKALKLRNTFPYKGVSHLLWRRLGSEKKLRQISVLSISSVSSFLKEQMGCWGHYFVVLILLSWKSTCLNVLRYIHEREIIRKIRNRVLYLGRPLQPNQNDSGQLNNNQIKCRFWQTCNEIERKAQWNTSLACWLASLVCVGVPGSVKKKACLGELKLTVIEQDIISPPLASRHVCMGCAYTQTPHSIY